jgi:hypothetical protein
MDGGARRIVGRNRIGSETAQAALSLLKPGRISMRIALAIPLLLLGACNVTKDGNSVTVQYDQNTAENTAADIGNTAQNIAGDIGNDVQKTGDKLENKIGDADIDVKINKDEHTNGASKTTTTTTTTTENKSN